MSELRETSIQRVLYRENLIMGGERELVMMLAVICGGLIISAQNLFSLVAIPLYLLGLYIFRLMAKSDPFMSKVYFRHFRDQAYYPPRSTPFAKK